MAGRSPSSAATLRRMPREAPPSPTPSWRSGATPGGRRRASPPRPHGLRRLLRQDPSTVGLSHDLSQSVLWSNQPLAGGASPSRHQPLPAPGRRQHGRADDRRSPEILRRRQAERRLAGLHPPLRRLDRETAPRRPCQRGQHLRMGQRESEAGRRSSPERRRRQAAATCPRAPCRRSPTTANWPSSRPSVSRTSTCASRARKPRRSPRPSARFRTPRLRWKRWVSPPTTRRSSSPATPS